MNTQVQFAKVLRAGSEWLATDVMKRIVVDALAKGDFDHVNDLLATATTIVNTVSSRSRDDRLFLMLLEVTRPYRMALRKPDNRLELAQSLEWRARKECKEKWRPYDLAMGDQLDELLGD